MMASTHSTGAEATSYIDGKVTDVREVHHHVTPLSMYFKIFAALIFLTGLTVAVSYLGLGEASIFVALLLAMIKASLVAGYFMHLKFDDRFHLFIFLATLLFVGIFFVFTFADLNTRDSINHEWGNYELQEETIRSNPAQNEAHEHIKKHKELLIKGHGPSDDGHH